MVVDAGSGGVGVLDQIMYDESYSKALMSDGIDLLGGYGSRDNLAALEMLMLSSERLGAVCMILSTRNAYDAHTQHPHIYAYTCMPLHILAAARCPHMHAHAHPLRRACASSS